MMKGTPSGKFVISLDFELMWGMFDKLSHDAYGKNLDGVHTAIPKLLELFKKYEIHATWATVGMLMHSDVDTLKVSLSEVDTRPQYIDRNLSAYLHAHEPELHSLPHRYFAPNLIQMILETPNQELASHTFSHYYCKEEQVDESDCSKAFAADIAAQKNVAAEFSHKKVRSLVFPRNQWTKEASALLAQKGYEVYRGTENNFIYQSKSEVQKTKSLLRALRLLDSYVNITGTHTYKLEEAQHEEIPLINVPSSRFLRPYSPKLSLFESLRLRRIQNAMTHAAKNGKIFHLWWHPHNFGINQKENFAFLEKLLKHYKRLHEQYGMQSYNMIEAATLERE